MAGYRGFLTVRVRDGRRVGPPQDLPVPPARIRARLALDLAVDADVFLDLGRRQATFIREMVDRTVPMADADTILDFGCGCGRLARWFADLEGPELHGCDYDPRFVEWCGENLPFLRVTRNQAEPPLAFARNSLDIVYAQSVMTHMPEDLERAWLLELRRVLRPGGVLWFSALGDLFIDLMTTDDERAAYGRGERVSRVDELPGTTICTAWHPPGYLERTLPQLGLEVVDFVPGTPETYTQDSYLARKPA
jgi:SAM-dependent methyltransferase